jgi:hypothetical protein
MRPLQRVIAGALFVASMAPTVAAAKKAPPSPGASSLTEGRRLMAAGNFSEACPKLAESEAQSAAPVTALTVAICWEKAGKLATAWSAYKAAVDVATSAHQKKSVLAAQHGVARVEPKVSRLTIKLADRASGTEVRRDGDVVPASDIGAAIPLDGGGHDIEVTAPGKKPWKSHVNLADSGQGLAVDVPALQSDTPAPAAALAEAPPAPEPEKPSRGQAQRIGGIVLGGVGVVGVALGVFAGVQANSTYKDALAACNNSTACAPGSPGLAKRDQAGQWATISDVGFIAGGAAIAGGVILYFTAPKGSGATTMGLAPATLGTGLSLVGRF